MRKIIFFLSFLMLCACMTYQTPPRTEWSKILHGATFNEMTDTMKIAKRPVFLGGGGKIIPKSEPQGKNQYGEEPLPSNLDPVLVKYMTSLEYELYDSLLKPGIQVQRVGTDVVLLLTRDSFMYSDAPEISNDGANTLKIIAKILKKYDATFMEIAGYTDAMRNKNASIALSLDMAQRVAIFMANNDINPARMFIIGRGSAKPIAAQDDIGRRTNRRVEIRLSPAR
ncbi:MAG: OmpA family protein [Alphaproteobacteria bacterium]|jgi:outer membrane protein OmpA-like peptidoglycan-associated protein|nr:OmpA family protein [Alphaproteobacteria bacterium]